MFLSDYYCEILDFKTYLPILFCIPITFKIRLKEIRRDGGGREDTLIVGDCLKHFGYFCPVCFYL